MSTTFKIGDSIKVKEGVIIRGLEELKPDHWQGRVIEIEEDNDIVVELDSICLQLLQKDYLAVCIEKETVIFNLHLNPEQVELAPERDREDDIEKAQDDLDFAYIEATEKPAEDEYEKEERQKHIITDKWIRHFKRSSLFKEMTKEEQENTDFVISVFSDYMFNYQGEIPTDWSAFAVKHVCLYTFPQKVSAEKKVFIAAGGILPKFFEFLASRNYLDNAEDLKETALEVKHEIVENSQDRSSWGPAKTFMMGAIEAGVDMDNQAELDAYLRSQQNKQMQHLRSQQQQPPGFDEDMVTKLLKLIEEKAPSLLRIPRHKKVTVEYKDGTIKENIVYKKVMKDVKSGKCKVTKV